MPNINYNPGTEELSVKVQQLNPAFWEETLAKHKSVVKGRSDDSMREYYDWDAINADLAQEYANNQETYDNFHTGDYVHGGGSWYDPSTGQLVYGVNPGISLDMDAYDPSQTTLDGVDSLMGMGEEAMGRDPHAFDIDRGDIRDIDPSLADIYTTDLDGAFDPTQSAIDFAGDLNAWATDIDGTHLGEAADLMRDAAYGNGPSQADGIYNQAWAETAYQLENQAADTRNRMRTGADSMQAAQASLAARARGSNSAGLAVLNSQNNTALGQAKLFQEGLESLDANQRASVLAGQTAANQAAITRAQEMEAARAAYGQLGNQIRQGDFQGVQNAMGLANTQYGVDGSYLQGAQQNTSALNQGGQFNAGQTQDAKRANQGVDLQVQQSNQNTSLTSQQNNDRTALDAINTGLDTEDQIRADQILGEQNFQEVAGQNADRITNLYTDQRARTDDLERRNKEAEEREIAGYLQAGGAVVQTGVNAVVDLKSGEKSGGNTSDRRAKDIHGRASTADFTDAHDYDYTYTKGDSVGERRKGPMSDELPDDLIYVGEDGLEHVNMNRALFRMMSAIGDLQRKQGKGN